MDITVTVETKMKKQTQDAPKTEQTKEEMKVLMKCQDILLKMLYSSIISCKSTNGVYDINIYSIKNQMLFINLPVFFLSRWCL